MEKENLKRCSAFITTKNYGRINKVMEEKTLLNMKMSKGIIIDMALSHFFKHIETDDINQYAIEHLQFINESHFLRGLSPSGVNSTSIGNFTGKSASGTGTIPQSSQ